MKSARRAAVPFYLWLGALALSLTEAGGIWDISWHRSIGRDTFWTPAHLCIQTGGILAGAICAYLILVTTFAGTAAMRANSVNVFGFRGPLGAFLTAWGGLTMVTSVPFDNWWHAAYGLDVKIVSPPHVLLILGGHCVTFGLVLLILTNLHRAIDAGSAAVSKLEKLYLYSGGILVVSQMFLVLQYVGNNNMLHGERPYRVAACVVPIAFALLAQAYRTRLPATIAASIYTALYIALILILPLFPAEPKLGPVFHPVTHMVPPNFPMLLIAPAIVLDLLNRRIRNWQPWLIASITSVVFVVVLVAAEWPFAEFLMTKWADNRFFGAMYFDFSARASDMVPGFVHPDALPALLLGLLKAVVCGFVGSLAGVYLGRWMRSVRR